MSYKPGTKFRIAILAPFISLLPTTSFAANVTFTVPVHIQNIHSDWTKVAVMCGGYLSGSGRGMRDDRALKVGEIDVSNQAGGSIDQTVSGSISVPSDADRWTCYLFIQHQGEASPRPPRTAREGIAGDLKTGSVSTADGAF